MRLNPVFFMREAFKNLRLNLLMSITAMTTTFICLLVLGIAILLGAHVREIISSVQQDVQIVAYFSPETNSKVDEIRKSVASYPEVSKVNYVSEAEALDKFKRDYRDRPEIYKNIGPGVLPASIELRLKDSASAGKVESKLRAEGFPESEIWYPQKTVQRFDEATSYIVWGLRGATALFLVTSVLLISNTIRLSIFARRNEIEVMKLVGASDGFVRTPFVLEGLVQGIIGAILAAVAVVWLDYLFVDRMNQALPFFPISNGAVDKPVLIAILAGVGAAIGTLGSFLSVRRFLKV